MTDDNPALPGGQVPDRGTARVFVGLKIAPDIAGALAAIARALTEPTVRLIAPADIHLTLVPPRLEDSVSGAAETLASAAARSGPFALTFQHIGYGPHPRRPRLLWARCALTEELASLRRSLLDAFQAREERPFQPHVTLARIRGSAWAIARKHPIDQAISLAYRVETVELFRSPPPGERGYRILASLPLGAPAAAPPGGQVMS